MKLKSLAGSIFHEFCHALHDVSKTEKTSNAWCLNKYLAKAWGDEEELRTITCYAKDPICDHCFDFCQSINKGGLNFRKNAKAIYDYFLLQK